MQVGCVISTSQHYVNTPDSTIYGEKKTYTNLIKEALQPTNLKEAKIIKDLNKETQHVFQLLEDFEISPKNYQILQSLIKAALLYRKSLTQMTKNVDQRENLVKNLFNVYLSSFTSEEIKHLDMQKNWISKFESFYSAPNTSMVLLYLFKFLKRQKCQSEYSDDFHKLMNDFCQLWFVITVANRFKEKQELVRCCIENFLKQVMHNLSKNEKILLPGGWLTVNNIPGHFQLYLIERLTESCFLKIKFNTHPLPGETEIPFMEQEYLAFEQLEMLTLDSMELLFSNSLLNKVKKLSADIIPNLFNVGRQYSNHLVGKSPDIQFDMQTDSFNCCFMSFFILLHYLKQNSYTSCEDVKGSCQNFRYEFQNFVLARLES